MTGLRRLFCALLACAAVARGAEDVFDRLEDALTVSARDGRLRARLSGTLDLEDYEFSGPAPALLHTDRETLFSPRLAMFLDAQLGARAYFFAQVRADRGFDPGAANAQIRLDEYALRLTPSRDGHVNIQLGKFATIVGNWTQRHGSWANPFITAPLPYENLTGMWDIEPVRSSNQLLQWSHLRPGLPAAVTAHEKFRRLPIIWGPSYATGAAVSGAFGAWRYAAEVKHAPLSSRPETWGRMRDEWSHPTVSARLGYQPDAAWDVGVSASAGSYLVPSARPESVTGRGRGSYQQLVLAQDVAFAWHHLQVWTEIYAARFEIPTIGHADTLAYYAEAKYKFTPQFFGALRWNQQLFGQIPDRGGRTPWGIDAWRIDLAPGYRFSAHTEFKLQYSLQRGDRAPDTYGHVLATQFTVRF